jgi:hypothetical protein
MMSEKIHDVTADWAKRAYVDDAKYKAMEKAMEKVALLFLAASPSLTDLTMA